MTDEAIAERGELQSVEDAEVLPDMKEEAQERVNRVRRLNEQSVEIWVDFAEEMYHINKHGLHQYVENPETGKNYTSFGEFVKQETIYSHRTARYMIQIWDWYSVQHDREFLSDMADLGWTKLSKLVEVATPESAEDWRKVAQNNSVRDLEKKLKSLESDEDTSNDSATEPADTTNTPDDSDADIHNDPGPGDVRTDPTERVVFQLFDDQNDRLQTALRKAKAIADKEDVSKGELLDCILLEFLGQHRKTDHKTKPLKYYLNPLERNLNVSLIAIKDDVIKYGEHHIDELLGEEDDEFI